MLELIVLPFIGRRVSLPHLIILLSETKTVEDDFTPTYSYGMSKLSLSLI